MVAELKGQGTAHLRSLYPEQAGYIDDFFLALDFPGAFDFKAMPVKWQTAMRICSRIFHKYQNCRPTCAFMT